MLSGNVISYFRVLDLFEGIVWYKNNIPKFTQQYVCVQGPGEKVVTRQKVKSKHA